MPLRRPESTIDWIAIATIVVLGAAYIIQQWVPQPPDEPVSNPTLEKIRKQSEVLQAWHELGKDARSLRDELSTYTPEVESERLAGFAGKTSAQRKFAQWVRQDGAATVEVVKEKKTGYAIWQRYRSALIKSNFARQKLRALVGADRDLTFLIQEIRSGIVVRTSDAEKLATLRARLKSINEARLGELLDRKSIEQTVDRNISAEIRRIRKTSS